jgi:hypothetical protein
MHASYVFFLTTHASYVGSTMQDDDHPTLTHVQTIEQTRMSGRDNKQSRGSSVLFDIAAPFLGAYIDYRQQLCRDAR